MLPTLADDELEGMLQTGMTVQLLGTRTDEARMPTGPGWISRFTRSCVSALTVLFNRPTLEQYLHMLKQLVWALPRMLYRFVSSLFLQHHNRHRE